MASHFVKAKFLKRRSRKQIAQLSVISEVNGNHSGEEYSVQSDSVENLVIWLKEEILHSIKGTIHQEHLLKAINFKLHNLHIH